MTSSYYDVAVLGARLEPLLCAALLAKRGLRVLVLGQAEPKPDYLMGPYSLPRSPFPFIGGTSPWGERIIEGLGLRQAVRQRLQSREPPMQAVVGSHRFDIPGDESRFHQEVVREFPEVKRQAEDLRRTLRQVDTELDDLLGRRLAWPPETFVERQRIGRALSMQRYSRAGDGWHPLKTLPQDHPLGSALRAVLPFLCDLTPSQIGDFATTRLLGQLFRSAGPLVGGWTWLREALVERIGSYSGEVRLNERAAHVDTRQGTVRGLTMARSGEDVGCGRLVMGTAVSDLLQLVDDRGPILELFEKVGEPRISSFRYTLNLVVRPKAVPQAWRSDLLLLGESRDSEGIALWIEPQTPSSGDHVILCASTLVPNHVIDETSYTLASYRQRVLSAIRSLLPFLDRDLLLVDSPHDGLPGESYPGGAEIEPTHPWDRGPHTMRAVFEYPERRGMGACGLPARTPIKRLLLCNQQIVPGLGLEGAFIAASSVARLVGRHYRGQDWIRRGLWSADSVAI